MAACANEGNLVCHFQGAYKFKARFATLGFSGKSNLGEGAMWPAAFALNQLNAAAEARIIALAERPVS